MKILMTLCNAEVMTSFATPEAWGWLLQFCIIAIGLLAGNILRRKVPFLRKSPISLVRRRTLAFTQGYSRNGKHRQQTINGDYHIPRTRLGLRGTRIEKQ